MSELVRAGKVRYLVNVGGRARDTSAGRRGASLAALQSEYSLGTRTSRTMVCCGLPRARHRFSPVQFRWAAGFLTGGQCDGRLAEDDARRTYPRFQPVTSKAFIAGSERRSDRLQRNTAHPHSSRSRGCSRRVATSSRSLDRAAFRVEENAAAVDVVLTATDVTTLDEIAPAGVAVGERYPPRSMSTVFR